MTRNRASPPAISSGERPSLRRPTFGTLLYSDPSISLHYDEEQITSSRRNSNASAGVGSSSGSGNTSPSPYNFMSPWNQPSPYKNSPWIRASPYTTLSDCDNSSPNHALIGSIVREEGHVYSIATSGNLLYTGSDSKNIRVWKNLKDYSGFKTNSGLVKAIVISGGRIFTGHQDGKIRVWRETNPYKRMGSLPTIKDFIKTSINPNNYVQVRRHKSVPWIKHYDAVSCLSLDEDRGILYSGSWDRTVKVWRISDSKCLESINAHFDAVNSVVVGFDGLIFTGSADGTIKMWRRELVGRSTQHMLTRVLLEQDNAVTAVATDRVTKVVYGATSDGLVHFWVREKHTLCHGGVLRGHKTAVLCLATAGSLVLSGSADRSICVWRREERGDHMLMSVLTGHSGPVKCLAIEEDQDGDKGDQRWIVYSGSLDRSVKVWRVSDRTLEIM